MLNVTALSHPIKEAPLGIMSFNDVSLVPEQALNMSNEELYRNFEQIGNSSYFEDAGCGDLVCPGNSPCGSKGCGTLVCPSN